MTERKYKSKDKKKPKMKITRHHITPTSRGGMSIDSNLSNVPSIQHGIYHNLFGNRTPEEIIDYLVVDFWNSQDEWVDKYISKYRSKK